MTTTEYADAPNAAPTADRPLLEVRGLRTEYRRRDEVVRAVDGVSFSIERGQVYAIVGESGCGKTATALSILGLVPTSAGRVVEGEVLFAGQDLLKTRPGELRSIRGDHIAIVFQEPILNPVIRVGDQVADVIRAHRHLSRREAAEQAVELLEMVRIPNPRQRMRHYPHQFSGGMRQRVAIAMAIALGPELLIADEPTTALDVTTQAQILELLLELRARLGMAMMLITHNLGVVAGVAERVMVMYAGRKVEEADVRDLFRAPKHPYTSALLRSTIRLDRPPTHRLSQIPGSPPSLVNLPLGCRFAPRCSDVAPTCLIEYPALRRVGHRHEAACHFATEDEQNPP